MVAIARLKPFPDNPREHSADQVEAIAALLREYGWTRPILIDETRTILAGHGALEAAALIGQTHAPTITIPGLTPEQKKAYVIADNQSALLSTWHEEKLPKLLAELGDVEAFDMRLTGFTLPEIGRLTGDPEFAPAKKGGTKVVVTITCPHCHKTFERKSRP